MPHRTLSIPFSTLLALFASGCVLHFDKEGGTDDTAEGGPPVDPDPCASITWYQDWDEDGFGNEDLSFDGSSCDDIPGFVPTAGDCDDGDPAIHPEADELCDGLDNDCSGEADDDLPDWYADADADGYGAGLPTESCDQPAEGMVGEAGDHDDEDATVYPGAPEFCDEKDNDQDGEIDEDGVDLAWYPDADGDGYGDAAADSVLTCETPGEGWLTGSGDCDDGDADVHPLADETCDHEDDDCDGEIDETGAIDGDEAWLDSDADGYGGGPTVLACSWDVSVVWNDEDCDDGSSAVYPGASEICDGELNDCELWGTGAEQDTDGSVSFESALGAWEDWTEDFSAGSADAPVEVDVTDSGTLRFCKGTYYAAISAEAARVGLVGVYGSDETVLSTNYGGAVFSVSGLMLPPRLSLQGLTIFESGGDAMAAVTVEEGTVDIADCTFESNWSETQSGAVYLEDGSLEVTGSTFSSNTSSSTTVGGGAVYAGNGWVQIANSSFVSNFSDAYGGALYTVNASLEIVDCSFVENQAPYGGGALLTNLSDSNALWISGSAFSGNETAEGIGGAIYEFDGISYIENTSFEDNWAAEVGGAIYDVGTILEIVDSSFARNWSTRAGGAISITDAPLTIRRADFSANVCSYDGGAVYLQGSGAYGVSVIESDFHDNSARHGAALYASAAVDLAISDSTFETNQVIGCGSVAYVGAGGTLTFSSSSATDNESQCGLFTLVEADLSCEESVISNNTDLYGAVYLYYEDSNLTSTTCTWSDNTPADVYSLPLDTAYDAADLSDPFTCTGADGCATLL